MYQSRKYDLGNGVIIEDDGHYIQAEVVEGNCHTHIGVRRPKPLPSPDEQVKITYGAYGRYYYLDGWAGPHGFWLSVKTWETKESLEAEQAEGLFGKVVVQITPNDSAVYYRDLLHFVGWDLKGIESKTIAGDDDLVSDYLVLVVQADEERVARFNEVIAPSGKDLDYIMSKIGDWEPVTELPIVHI